MCCLPEDPDEQERADMALQRAAWRTERKICAEHINRQDFYLIHCCFFRQTTTGEVWLPLQGHFQLRLLCIKYDTAIAWRCADSPAATPIEVGATRMQPGVDS